MFSIYTAKDLIIDISVQGHIADGPDGQVLAGPTFTEGKNKISILHKASNKQSARVIFGLARHVIL